MKKLIFIIILVAFILLPVFGLCETCPCCGQDIAPIITIQVDKNPNGTVKVWTHTLKDSYGTLLNLRIEEYTYYSIGGINEIRQKVYDSKDTLMSDRKIKHYRDGRRPTIMNISTGGAK